MSSVFLVRRLSEASAVRHASSIRSTSPACPEGGEPASCAGRFELKPVDSIENPCPNGGGLGSLPRECSLGVVQGWNTGGFESLPDRGLTPGIASLDAWGRPRLFGSGNLAGARGAFQDELATLIRSEPRSCRRVSRPLRPSAGDASNGQWRQRTSPDPPALPRPQAPRGPRRFLRPIACDRPISGCEGSGGPLARRQNCRPNELHFAKQKTKKKKQPGVCQPRPWHPLLRARIVRSVDQLRRNGDLAERHP